MKLIGDTGRGHKKINKFSKKIHSKTYNQETMYLYVINH